MLFMPVDEGYIKYKQHFESSPILPEEDLAELNEYRNRLHEMNLIGVYDDGIGFGNISVRQAGRRFIISGTQTGQIPMLSAKHYTLITNYNIAGNQVWCSGPVKASSESLTHAAIYELSTEINAVIHIHSLSLWRKWLNVLPTTAPEVTYGTPEMAFEVKRLYDASTLKESRVMIMAGHEEGIVSFGKTLSEAFQQIEQL